MPGIIENPKGLDLPTDATGILQEMFADYGRVVIKQEFGGGLSGSRVFLVRPIRGENEEDRPELPVVVKLAPVGLIEKEWRAYQRHIRHRLMGIAEIRGKPVLLPGSGWGGLCYPLLGGGTFEVVSLNRYCREAGLADIEFVLGRLLKIIEQMIRLSQPFPEFHLRASYDRLLPVNLLIEPRSLPPAVRPTVIEPEALPAEPLQPGDYVRLEGFTITEVEPAEQTVTLNLPGTTEGPAASYRLRLQGVEGIATDQVDQMMPPLEGVVIETCLGRLRTEAQTALGQSLDLTAATVALPDGRSLPNPLTRLAELLDETRDVRLGRVHGDMNLENILVDPEVRDVNLIDFSEARRDHVLHDFLYLEMEVMTKLIPEILHEHRLPAGATILQLYEQLHRVTFHSGDFGPQLPHAGLAKPFTILQTIRQTARRYLLDYYDCSEYYQGLALYLLGALKFRDLSEAPKAPLPKQVAFWGAATLVGMLSGEAIEMVQRSSSIKKEASASLSPPPAASPSPVSVGPGGMFGRKIVDLLTGKDKEVGWVMLAIVSVVAVTALAIAFWPRNAALTAPTSSSATSVTELTQSPATTQPQPSVPPGGATSDELDPLLTFTASSEAIRALAFSPDGRKLASGGEDTIIRVWDTSRGQELLSLEGHTDIVTSVTWSPDGQRLASGSDDKTIRIWDAATGAQVSSPLLGHTNFVLGLAWSPDGKRLASGGWDRQVIVWDAGGGAIVSSADIGMDAISVAWSPDSTRLAVSSTGWVLVLDPNSGEELQRLSGEWGDSWDVAWSPDGQYLAAAGHDNNIHIWQADHWENERLLKGHTNTVTSIVWSPDNRRLASAAYDATARMWDVATGTELSPALTLRAGTGVLTIDWSRDGRRLAASGEGTIWIWDATVFGQAQPPQ